MGIDHLDLYYAHKDDPHTPLEKTLEAFHKLIKAGKIRFVGASNYRAWRLADADAIAAAQGGLDLPALSNDLRTSVRILEQTLAINA